MIENLLISVVGALVVVLAALAPHLVQAHRTLRVLWDEYVKKRVNESTSSLPATKGELQALELRMIRELRELDQRMIDLAKYQGVVWVPARTTPAGWDAAF